MRLGCVKTRKPLVEGQNQLKASSMSLVPKSACVGICNISGSCEGADK